MKILPYNVPYTIICFITCVNDCQIEYVKRTCALQKECYIWSYNSITPYNISILDRSLYVLELGIAKSKEILKESIMPVSPFEIYLSLVKASLQILFIVLH